jgi:hypothetical protein
MYRANLVGKLSQTLWSQSPAVLSTAPSLLTRLPPLTERVREISLLPERNPSPGATLFVTILSFEIPAKALKNKNLGEFETRSVGLAT